MTSTWPRAPSPEFHSRQGINVSCKPATVKCQHYLLYICKPESTEKTLRAITPFYLKKTWDVIAGKFNPIPFIVPS